MKTLIPMPYLAFLRIAYIYLGAITLCTPARLPSSPSANSLYASDPSPSPCPSFSAARRNRDHLPHLRFRKERWDHDCHSFAQRTRPPRELSDVSPCSVSRRLSNALGYGTSTPRCSKRDGGVTASHPGRPISIYLTAACAPCYSSSPPLPLAPIAAGSTNMRGLCARGEAHFCVSGISAGFSDPYGQGSLQSTTDLALVAFGGRCGS